MAKTAIALALAATTVLTSAPALAQSAFRDRSQNIEYRIERGVQDGSLTRFEARRLHRQLYELKRVSYRYQRDGLQGWERRDLDRRFDSLSQQIRFARHD